MKPLLHLTLLFSTLAWAGMASGDNNSDVPTEKLTHGADHTADGFYIHFTVAVPIPKPLPEDWVADSMEFRFVVPHKVSGTTLDGCVLHIVDDRGKILTTVDISTYGSTPHDKEWTYDFSASRKLARRMVLVFYYTTPVTVGNGSTPNSTAVTKYYEVPLGDHLATKT